MKNGYLTVYLSLTLSILLSLILTLVEGARINTMKLSLECAADIGMNSVLAEFHRELLEQYDLLFVDTSYGTTHCSVDNTREHLRKYITGNFEIASKNWDSVREWLALYVDQISISEYALASDNKGNVMRHQALEYMESSSVEGAIGKILDNKNEIENLKLNTRDIEKERGEVRDHIESIGLPKHIREDGTEEEVPLENPADHVDAYRGMGVLNLVLDDTSVLSQTGIEPERYLSNRSTSKGSGIPDGSQLPDSMMDRIIFNQYLMQKCGSYGETMEKSLLKYQIEYILMGKDSDWENLEKTITKLLIWREVSNVIYLFSDTEKCAQAQAIALAMTAVLLSPELAEPVKLSLLFAWAYVESISDVKILLKGKKVPILKSAADWKTGISCIIGFNGRAPDTDGSDNGLSYQDYLKVMLLLEEDETVNMRAMDIMEMDIRRTIGNAGFRMDGCFDSFTAQIAIASEYGYTFDITKKYGYSRR